MMNREILRLALPSIIANITVPIVGMVDIAVAGHLDVGAATCIGGISIGSMLFDLLYWNFGFLRAGTGGLTAQAYGRGDMRECARSLCRGVGLALLIAAAILAIQIPFTRLAFLVVDCTPEVRGFALKYFSIRVWAAPATLSLMTFRGWFVGMQDTVSSMWTDFIVNGVNIAGSVILALGIGRWGGLGFSGVALGTVLAQYSGLAYAVGVTAVRYRRVFSGVTTDEARSSFTGSEMRGFFSMNIDLFMRSLGFILIYIGFTTISARFGDIMLASSAIMMKLLMIFSYFTDGFAYAGQALAGRFIGAGDDASLRSCVREIFIWSMAVAAAFMLIYWTSGVPMLRVMTSDVQVIDACRQFIPWLILMPPLGCAAFTWDGIYEGATASKAMRNAMLASAACFFIAWTAGKNILDSTTVETGTERYRALAIHILLGAYFMHLLVRTVWLTLSYKKSIKIN